MKFNRQQPTRPEDVVMPFGKHRGKTLGDIIASDPAYIDWLTDRDLSPALADAIKQVSQKYEAEIDRAIDAAREMADESQPFIRGTDWHDDD